MRALEDWAWKQPIPWKHKGVLVALARAYNREGGCFAGQPAIGELMGVSERKVRESEKWLTESGFIRRRRRHRANGSHTSDEVTFSSPLQAAISAASLPAESAASAEGATGRICQSYRQNLPHHKREVEKGRGSNGSSYVAGSFNRDLDLDGGARPPEGKEAGDVETDTSNTTTTHESSSIRIEVPEEDTSPFVGVPADEASAGNGGGEGSGGWTQVADTLGVGHDYVRRQLEPYPQAAWDAILGNAEALGGESGQEVIARCLYYRRLLDEGVDPTQAYHEARRHVLSEADKAEPPLPSLAVAA